MNQFANKRERSPGPPHIAAQVAASWATLDAASRAADLANTLRSQDRAFLNAMSEMQAVRNFVGSPHNILGSAATKHGEIAEQVNVGIRRATDALFGRAPSATFDGVGRFAPADYRMDGVDIQSKYYNGIRNTLDGVLGHSDKYPDFASGGRYQIPRDQYQQLDQLSQTGRIDGYSESSANAIRNRLDSLKQQTGSSPDDLIEPGEATYDEVQKGRARDTISDREDRLARENEDLKQAARAEHSPSLAGLGKASALGATAGGGVALTQAIWIKYREGKNPFKGEFSTQDWQDVGLTTLKGAGGGAVAGGALYLVTNSTSMSAPFAGSLVSGLMGIGSLLRQYHAGQINGDQFVEMSCFVAADAAVVGLCAIAGQTIIPIPALGALIGSVGGKIVASAIKNVISESESELIEQLGAYEKAALARLDSEFQALMQKLDAYFGDLERMAEVAFDSAVNTRLRLDASVRFAETVGVSHDIILHTTDDLDKFMTE